MDDRDDINFELNNFYKSFHLLLRHFRRINFDTMLFLFKSYCMHLYGICQWNDCNIFKSKIYKAFEKVYASVLYVL